MAVTHYFSLWSNKNKLCCFSALQVRQNTRRSVAFGHATLLRSLVKFLSRHSLKGRGCRPPNPNPVRILSGERHRSRVWRVALRLVKTVDQLAELRGSEKSWDTQDGAAPSLLPYTPSLFHPRHLLCFGGNGLQRNVECSVASCYLPGQDQVLKLEPLLPSISSWVIKTVEKGYRIQFAHCPPRFSVVSTTMKLEQVHLLSQELQSLLGKGAIEHVPLPERESGYYSLYFLVLSNFRSSRSEPFSQNIQVQNANNWDDCVSNSTQKLVCHSR